MELSELGSIQFPCEFPIKIIGVHGPGFEEEITSILLRHVPDLLPENVIHRSSSGGKYLSVSAVFIAQTREQVDKLYIELTGNPKVKFVL